MPAFLVTDIEWHDEAKATEYREKLGPVMEKFGGKTLAVGAPTVLEGSWKPARLVIVEFPTVEALRSWYASAEYQPVLKLRHEGARTNMVVLDRPPT
jgi:uncharacterized protein (DUF1330 family)